MEIFTQERGDFFGGFHVTVDQLFWRMETFPRSICFKM